MVEYMDECPVEDEMSMVEWAGVYALYVWVQSGHDLTYTIAWCYECAILAAWCTCSNNTGRGYQPIEIGEAMRRLGVW